MSDDEVSITSESPEDYRNRSLQVVGKWNSNGQGEAVLEMQVLYIYIQKQIWRRIVKFF